MFHTLHTIPKSPRRLVDFLAEAMLAELVPILQTALWCAVVAVLPWVLLEWFGCTEGWTTLAAATSALGGAAIPLTIGLRRIARRARRQYCTYAEYEM